MMGRAATRCALHHHRADRAGNKTAGPNNAVSAAATPAFYFLGSPATTTPGTILASPVMRYSSWVLARSTWPAA